MGVDTHMIAGVRACLTFTPDRSSPAIQTTPHYAEALGCWRTLDGAQAFLTVRSYVATARKHGINPLAALRRLFEGDPWLPAPAPR
jgi:transposase